jgi:hypothetical protein
VATPLKFALHGYNLLFSTICFFEFQGAIMEGFDHKSKGEKHDFSEVESFSASDEGFKQNSRSSKGSSVQESDLKSSLDEAFESSNSSQSNDDHNHAKPEGAGNFSFHVSLSNVDGLRDLNAAKVKKEKTLSEDVGARGDLLDPGGGKNTVIGSGDKDVILGNKGGFNTITTGTGSDTIILGKETTNRIFDFDPSKDRFVLADGLDPKNIVIAQGKNPGKGGLDQPLDSVNNALIIDKSSEHILGALTFTKASALNDNHFTQLDSKALDSLKGVSFNVKEGSGQLTGTRGHDKLVGGGGDDFLYVGDDGFKTNTAKGNGPGEFPFPNDSPGTTELNSELKSGVLRVSGSYKDFDGLPLFSKGEKEIDPKAVILNGSDPKALIDGFLKVPNDVEGNPISGTHLHFSPSEDSRGNFADATVIRYFQNTSIDAKSGTISGEFELTPEEQAAFLAGNLYANLHTNVDGDGDGKGGFPTGENRINFNQNVIQFV